MLPLALKTYVHLVFIIVVISCITIELMTLKPTMSYKTVNWLSRVDGFYGFAAIIVVTTGILNWLQFGKGAAYYNNNSLFILKFFLFVLVGLLSIYPTVMILRLKKRNKDKQPEAIEMTGYASVRKVIVVELIIMLFIPLLAELMANGIDI